MCLTVKDAGLLFYGASTKLEPGKDEPPGRQRRTRPLSSTGNPEEKRRIIGDTFMRVANDMIDELKLKPQDVYLGQGKRPSRHQYLAKIMVVCDHRVFTCTCTVLRVLVPYMCTIATRNGCRHIAA